jgi:hypothetical protein
MPRISYRQQWITSLEELFVLDFFLKLLSWEDDDENEGISPDFIDHNTRDIFEVVLICAPHIRYFLPHNPTPKNNPISLEFLETLPPDQFLLYFRMERESFIQILALIDNDPIFKNDSYFKQASPAVQLAITLYRLGVHGWGAAPSRIASLFGIGGGTVHLYFHRCLSAILKLYERAIVWPRGVDQQLVKGKFSEMTDGAFNDCIGMVDSPVIDIQNKPGMQGPAYFDCKSNYSMNMQAVCDWNYQFTYVSAGFPSSVHDSTAFKATTLYLHPAQHFDGVSEYLLGDKAYALTTRLLTPYKEPYASQVAGRFRCYNKKHAKARVVIETTFGILKGWFGWLKLLPINIGSPDAHGHAVQWILAACILHNLLRPMEDNPEEWLDGFVEVDGPVNAAHGGAGSQWSKDFRSEVRQFIHANFED